MSGRPSDAPSATGSGGVGRGRDDRFMPSRPRGHASPGAVPEEGRNPATEPDAQIDPGLVATSSPVGLAVVDGSWRCRWVNRTAAAIVGREPFDVVGLRWTDFAADKDVPALVDGLDHVAVGGAVVAHAISPLFALERAVELRIQPFVAPERPGERLFVVAMQDVSDRRRIERDLASQAGHDPLTGLPNRATVLEHVDAAMRAVRDPDGVVVAFVDLDGFKPVNETLGHAVGDQVLAAVARRLRQAAARDEVIGRVGGDEFVACAGPGPPDPRGLGHRILRSLSEPIPVRDGLDVRIGASIGLVVVDHAETAIRAEEVLRRADAAMYGVKRRGGGTFEVFGASHAAQLSAAERWDTELRRAIDERRIQPHYQPVVETGSGRIVGVEALVRWHHEVNGVMYPDEFLEPASSVGAHGELTGLVVDAAIRQASTWRDAMGPACPTVAVNLGAADVADPALAARLGSALTAAGLPPASFGVEIAEAVVDRDPGRASTLIHELRDRGIAVALDDFGGGHSVLARLGRLPVRTLKLDRSLVAPLGSGDETLRRRAVIVLTALVELAHGLDMVVVAEGVERVDDLVTLTALGCDMTQGFVHGPPVPAEELDVSSRRPGGTRAANSSPPG